MIHRSQIRNADYNPRRISDDARKLLKDNLKRVGLIEPIVWNRRTGNIVGGHQRIAAMDSLEKSQDYRLTVAVVDLDDTTEKEQNVFLNNPKAQGDWDIEKLNELVKGIDFEHAGFTSAEIYQLFGENPMAEQNEAVDELAKQVRETRERYEAVLKRTGGKRDATDYFCVLVFKDPESRGELAEALGLDDNKWVDGRLVVARLKGAAPASKAPQEPEPVPQ